MASRATFVARTIDTETKHLRSVLLRAATHRGSAFVEILQNCNIFNDGAFDHLKARAVREDRLLMLEHGEPLTFGTDQSKGLRPAGPESDHYFEVASTGSAAMQSHDEASPNDALVYALATMGFPEFPLPLGILRAVAAPTHESLIDEQVRAARSRQPGGSLKSLLAAGDCWTIDADPSNGDGTGS